MAKHNDLKSSPYSCYLKALLFMRDIEMSDSDSVLYNESADPVQSEWFVHESYLSDSLAQFNDSGCSNSVF